MSLHLLFDLSVVGFALWYVPRRILREIRWWRSRTRADIEMERISSEATEKLRRIRLAHQEGRAIGNTFANMNGPSQSEP